MPDARVRPAEPADVPAIERVAREAWHAAYDDILGERAVETVLDDWYAPDDLRESVDGEDHVFPVATAEDLQGFAHAGTPPGSDDWHLFRLYVHPDHWGRGIGTALLDHVEAALAQRGVSTYELAVLAENDVGVSFYESRGFERVGTETVELAGVETTEYWYRTGI